MGGFVKGDVVVLPFPFSDLSANKRRPALVVAPVEGYDDLILCMITSSGARDKNAVAISSSDFESGGLPRESNMRPNRLFTAEGSIVLRRAGHLSTTKVQEVVQEIIQLIS
jgi:mRNA interferase MazF